MNSLEDMESQAQRHLDGSRVNTDRMAKNVLALVAMVRALQQQAHEDQEPAYVGTVPGGEPRRYNSAREAIDDMLRGAGLG